jgi:hypothetical protein
MASVHLLLNAVVNSAPALSSLKCINVECGLYAAMDLLPLTRMRLSTLIFQPVQNARLSQRQLSTLKQLATLTRLDVHRGWWVAGDLRSLCSKPHQLQHLTEIDVSQMDLTTASLSVLANLPALSSLLSRFIEVDALRSLPMFANLTTLRLNFQNTAVNAAQTEIFALL